MRRYDPFARFGLTKKTQLTTKSDQWFNDARFLFEQKRFNAALYLGGFVIECLLKAKLFDRRREENIRDLLFSHDLDKLLKADIGLTVAMDMDRSDIYTQFVRVSNWNVRIRYNPAKISQDDADDFMRRLKVVRQ